MASKLIKIPDLCDTFEFKLVEELALSDPLDYHYGKCTAIGRLARDQNTYYLENIQLKFMRNEYQLPTGSVQVILLPERKSTSFVIGAFVEVHGIAAFWRSDLDWDEHGRILPKTTRDLIVEQRRNYVDLSDLDSQAIIDAKEMPDDGCFNDDEIKENIEKFNQIWKPAIQVYTMNIVSEAEELIHCNLRTRLLRKKHKRITELS